MKKRGTRRSVSLSADGLALVENALFHYHRLTADERLSDHDTTEIADMLQRVKRQRLILEEEVDVDR